MIRLQTRLCPFPAHHSQTSERASLRYPAKIARVTMIGCCCLRPQESNQKSIDCLGKNRAPITKTICGQPWPPMHPGVYRIEAIRTIRRSSEYQRASHCETREGPVICMLLHVFL